jgi:hypothetical protein
MKTDREIQERVLAALAWEPGVHAAHWEPMRIFVFMRIAFCNRRTRATPPQAPAGGLPASSTPNLGLLDCCSMPSRSHRASSSSSDFLPAASRLARRRDPAQEAASAATQERESATGEDLD